MLPLLGKSPELAMIEPQNIALNIEDGKIRGTVDIEDLNRKEIVRFRVWRYSSSEKGLLTTNTMNNNTTLIPLEAQVAIDIANKRPVMTPTIFDPILGKCFWNVYLRIQH